MPSWPVFVLGLALVSAIQWTALFFLPMSFTYYEQGMAKRRKIRLGHLIRQMAHGNVEMHGSLLYMDSGSQKGNVGAHWSVLALAMLVIGPWVVQTDSKRKKTAASLQSGQRGPPSV